VLSVCYGVCVLWDLRFSRSPKMSCFVRSVVLSISKDCSAFILKGSFQYLEGSQCRCLGQLNLWWWRYCYYSEYQYPLKLLLSLLNLRRPKSSPNTHTHTHTHMRARVPCRSRTQYNLPGLTCHLIQISYREKLIVRIC
jgi:hypothetical protein